MYLLSVEHLTLSTSGSSLRSHSPEHYGISEETPMLRSNQHAKTVVSSEPWNAMCYSQPLSSFYELSARHASTARPTLEYISLKRASRLPSSPYLPSFCVTT